MYFSEPKFAILFPGQGSQHVGMCGELMQKFPVIAEIFEEADGILGFHLSALMLKGTMKELTLSQYAQPAIVVASYALFRIFKELINATPACVAGHSLGEISALIATTALSFAEGVSYARKRGEIMHKVIEEKKGRAALVVDIEADILTDIVETIKVKDYLTVSGYNSPRQFIVVGTQTSLLSLEKEITKNNAELIPFSMMPMKADAPYHSSLMAFLKPEFEELLQKIQFNKPTIDIWSTVTADRITSEKDIPNILCNQLTVPVYWNQILKKMCAAEIDLFIDIGPNSIMRNLTKEDVKLPTCFAFDDQEDRGKIIKCFQKLNKEREKGV